MLLSVRADYVPPENADQLSLTVMSKARDVWLLADEIKTLVSGWPEQSQSEIAEMQKWPGSDEDPGRFVFARRVSA